MRVNLKAGELPSALHVSVMGAGRVLVQKVQGGCLVAGGIEMDPDEADALALMLETAAISARCAAKAAA